MFSTLALSFSPTPARLRSNFSLGKISGERMRRAKRRRNAREKSREKCTNPLARTLGRKAMGLARAFFIVTRSRQTRRISFHDRRRVCMYTYGRLRVRAGENFICKLMRRRVAIYAGRDKVVVRPPTTFYRTTMRRRGEFEP